MRHNIKVEIQIKDENKKYTLSRLNNIYRTIGNINHLILENGENIKEQNIIIKVILNIKIVDDWKYDKRTATMMICRLLINNEFYNFKINNLT